MRTAVLAALGLLTIVPPLTAQDQPTTWAAKLLRDEKTNQIPTGHDFKTVPKGAMLQHRFQMTNPYAVPLQVWTKVSCGCVTATPNPAVLQPKETGTLDITMDTTRFNGVKTVTVNVEVQHYDQRPQFWSSTSLVVQAVCRGDVELTPAQAVFGVVPAGQAVERQVVIRYRGGMPGWQITGGTPDSTGPFDVRYQEQNRRGTSAEYRVWLVLKNDAAAGSYKGDLSLTTNDPNNPVVAVPYDALVQAPLTVLPSSTARLGTVPVGTTRENRLFVKASQPFRIVGIDGEGDGVTASFLQAPVPTQVLTIKVQPTQAGPVQKVLTVKTDLNGGATVAVKVEATAVAP